MSDTDEAPKTEAPVRLDARRNAFRPDLAAESLYGKVSAPNYVQGYPAQVVRASVPLRMPPLADRRVRDRGAVRRDRHRLRRARRLGLGAAQP